MTVFYLSYCCCAIAITCVMNRMTCSLFSFDSMNTLNDHWHISYHNHLLSNTLPPIQQQFFADVSHYCALLIPQPPQYSLHDTFNLNLDYACSSSYGSKRDRASTSLSNSEDDDNDYSDDYSTDIGAEMEMKKVRNNIFLHRQTICSDSKREIPPRTRDRGQYYTHESTTQNNNNTINNNNTSNETLNILSDNASSSEHRITSSSQTTTSSCGSSFRSDFSSSSRTYQRDNNNLSEKSCNHLNIIHSAKSASKQLRIHSKMVSNDNSSNDSNSGNDRSSSSSSSSSPGMDTNVDSPITDGNDSA